MLTAVQIEYSNLLNRIQTDGMELPSRKDYEQKRASIEKYKDYVMSEVRCFGPVATTRYR